MNNKFAENLKKLRKEAGLTQSRLADKTGLNQRKISYFEKGDIEPDLNTLIQLAKFFNVTTDYLLGVE